MSFDKDTLFKLLPAFNRIRDQQIGNSLIAGEEQDGPLKALLGLISEQVQVLEENFDQLYDDQFIETCAEWVVPYIGELVGTRELVNFPNAPFSQRAQVANTIAYRRRKGTAPILEELARDVTGWTANVVEYFRLLATTQYLNHTRPNNLGVTSLRDWEKLEYVNTPFDKLARTVDVRNIQSGKGKYNIPNIGIFLWRLDDYAITHAPAYKVDAMRYKFDALGKDVQLYNHSEPEKEITHLAEHANVPAPLSRLMMYHYTDQYYGADKSVYIHGVPEICICNLCDLDDGTGNWANMPTEKVAIDPVLGRVAFPAAQTPNSPVFVNYYYAFSDAMGGGEYERISSLLTGDFKILKVPEDKPTIQAALDALKSTGGIIEITTNDYYIETPVAQIDAGKIIEIRAANKKRPVLVLDNDFEITGQENSSFLLNGLLINGGSIRIPQTDNSGNLNNLEALSIAHCTLVPGDTFSIGTVAAQIGTPRLVVETDGVNVVIEKSILGPIRSVDTATITINNSIIDAIEKTAMAYCGIDGPASYGAVLHLENVTIIGNVFTRIMQLASNTIFFAELDENLANEFAIAAERLQEGCVRFSYVPPQSRLPKKYHCRPAEGDDALAVAPMFTTLQYGNAAYCQLSTHCATAITTGADNDAEMGAFRNLYQPQRITNLQIRLKEYLKFGLEAGIFNAS